MKVNQAPKETALVQPVQFPMVDIPTNTVIQTSGQQTSIINMQTDDRLIDIFKNKHQQNGSMHDSQKARNYQNKFSLSDLLLICFFNIAEFALSFWTSIYWISFRFDAEIDTIVMSFIFFMCFMEFAFICVGIYGQISKNGQNWYRYACHWSFLFTAILFPNQWKQCKQKWKSGAITIMTRPKFNALRILMSFLIILFVLRYLLTEQQTFADEAIQFEKDQAHIPIGLLFLCSAFSIFYRWARTTSCCCFKH